jgi:hypothetical protein
MGDVEYECPKYHGNLRRTNGARESRNRFQAAHSCSIRLYCSRPLLNRPLSTRLVRRSRVSARVSTPSPREKYPVIPAELMHVLCLFDRIS